MNYEYMITVLAPVGMVIIGIAVCVLLWEDRIMRKKHINLFIKDVETILNTEGYTPIEKNIEITNEVIYWHERF